MAQRGRPSRGSPAAAGGDERLDGPLFYLPRPGRRGISTAARWLAAAMLAGLAAALLSGAGRPAAPGRPVGAGRLVPVLVAAHDLPAGVPLRRRDVRTRELPASAVPAGALGPGGVVAGHSVAGPVRAGEVLTDVRLMGASLVRAVAGRSAVAAPIRIADAGTVRFVHPGDRVDVVGTDAQGAGPAAPVTLARDVMVVAVPGASRSAQFAPDGGALVVVATTPAVARRLAGASMRDSLALVVRGR